MGVWVARARVRTLKMQQRAAFIEPAGRMELRDYQDAIEETRELWSEIE